MKLVFLTKLQLPIRINTKKEKELDELFLEIAQKAKPDDKPTNVLKFTAIPFDSTRIKLTWERVLRADSYRIYQRRESESHMKDYIYSQIESTGIAPLEYIVTRLSPNTTYHFKIEAVNSIQGTVSNVAREAQATTLP